MMLTSGSLHAGTAWGLKHDYIECTVINCCCLVLGWVASKHGLLLHDTAHTAGTHWGCCLHQALRLALATARACPASHAPEWQSHMSCQEPHCHQPPALREGAVRWPCKPSSPVHVAGICTSNVNKHAALR